MAEPHPHGVHRYRSVTEGVAMANEYLSSRLSISEFARQKGVSFKMVKYWTTRARRLAAEAGQGSPSQMEPRDLVAVGSVDEHGVMEPAALRPAAPVPAALRVDAPAAPAAIEIHLGNGVRIAVGPGFSPEVLRSVVACLGASC